MVYICDFLQILPIHLSTQLLHMVLKCLDVVQLPHLLWWPGHQAASPAATLRARIAEAYMQKAPLCLFSSCF